MPRIIITEPGKSPQPYRFKIDRTETKIGRGSDNDIIIEAGSASTHHCVMKRVPGGFTLEDLGSTNGIKKDGTLFKIIDLIDGDSIKIGDDVDLDFTLSEEEIEQLETEEFESQQQAMLPKSKKTEKPDSSSTFEGEDDTFEEEDEDYDEPAPSPRTYEAQSSKGMNSFVFLILALIALAIGFSIRHYQDVLSKPKAQPATEQDAKP